MAMICRKDKVSKTGEPIIIRSAISDDALSIFAIQQSVVAENNFVITTPRDLNSVLMFKN